MLIDNPYFKIWFVNWEEVLIALSEKITLPSFMVILEILASRRAVKFAGIHHFIFESDSKIAINALPYRDMHNS